MIRVPKQLFWRSRRSLFGALACLGLLGLGAFLAGRYLWSNYHFRKARVALDQGDLPRARAGLERCLELWPWSARAHRLAARAAWRTGDYDAAEGHLRECERLQGTTDAVELEWALLGAQQGRLPRLEGYLLERAQQENQDAPLILEVLTREYAESYRLARALYCIDLWLEHQPDRVLALFWQGQILEQLSLPPSAVAAYRRVLSLDPEQDEARLRLAGLLLLDNRNAEEVLEHLKWLAQRHPDNAAVQLRLASCLSDLNRADEARAVLDKLLSARPDYGPALVERSKLALLLNQSVAAEEWARKALSPQEQPANDLVYQRLANDVLYQCLAMRGLKDEAERHRAEVQRLTAVSQRVQELNKKIAEAPGDPSWRYEMGMVLLQNGRDQQGLAWLTSALQEDPQHQPTRKALADYHTRAGNHAPAVPRRPFLLVGTDKELCLTTPGERE